MINNKVYERNDNGNFDVIYAPSDGADNINFLSDEGTTLMIGIENNNNSRTIFMDQSGNFTERSTGCISKGVYAVEDEKGRVWYADLWEPVKYTEGKTTGECKN